MLKFESGVVGVLMATLSFGAWAGSAAGTGGATEVTQIMNNVQLADSYAQQTLQVQNDILRYQALVQSLQKNPLGVTLPNLNQLAVNQARIMQNTQSIATDMGTVDRNFANQFKNPQAGQFGVKFGVIANASLDALRAAMDNAGAHQENIKADSAHVQDLVAAAKAAGGTTAALDALAGLNAEQLKQSIALRDLISQQQVATSQYMATQVTKDAKADLDKNSMLDAYQTSIDKFKK